MARRATPGGIEANIIPGARLAELYHPMRRRLLPDSFQRNPRSSCLAPLSPLLGRFALRWIQLQYSKEELSMSISLQ